MLASLPNYTTSAASLIWCSLRVWSVYHCTLNFWTILSAQIAHCPFAYFLALTHFVYKYLVQKHMIWNTPFCSLSALFMSWLTVYLILSPEDWMIRSGLSSSVMCDTQQTFNHWLARWIIQTAGSVAGTMTNTHPHTRTYNARLPTHMDGPHLRSFQQNQAHVHFACVIFTVAPFVAHTFVYFPQIM